MQKPSAMYYVVGSGPAGVACAHALASEGHEVTILDAGVTLEPEREAVARMVGDKPRAEWSEQEIKVLRTVVPKSGEVPFKLVHGSNYPYQRPLGAPDIRYGKLSIRASYAKGGLSNVWGAALFPYSAEDIRDWPVRYDELASGYVAALNMLPVAGQEDDLSAQFPIAAQSMSALRQSTQIRHLLERSGRLREALLAEGISVGGSRLAVNADEQSDTRSCYYCGYCLHGCPRDVVYSSRHTLQQLISTGRVHYRPHVIVQSVRETQSGVIIEVMDRDGVRSELSGGRVFLGAGTINSTVILLRSLGLYERRVQFKDSQYFLFPMLQTKGSPAVADEALYTLSQAFIELADAAISPHAVHLQVYSYNDHLEQLLDHKLGPLKHVFPKNAVLGRLLLVQAYLHSAHSGLINGVLRRTSTSDVFDLSEALNSQTKAKVGQVVAKLRANSGALGAFPVSRMLQITEPGRGFHTGGSFPMAAHPKVGQTDTLGRPHGMTFTHVIDSTVFPSIPATTITLTVMANAYRIGKAVTRLAPESACALRL
ncbi:GMC oxidoreductase [Paraburkholderia sp. DHOC27]|uniref:GMC oxidoreductase n=1 Tax=Paraburkholderia sp. DHOC27 TaxID=2303330 RepID=UPI000E3CFE5D|nr:GMC oxidoreductase [Paraburkholderia sp. DHOC27]RFU46258.1 GMC family oxidoreductase [Paraburkholderia sp. DHOC27]